MRPVNKLPWPEQNGAPKSYKPHTLAKIDLEDNLGYYCCYCEVFSSDLEVEHIISQDQDLTKATDWDNFLLACGRCNGKDNKSNKPVALDTIHFPHKNNTLFSFTYLEGGFVCVNQDLAGDSVIHAENMLNLVGLDKYPGNIKYPQLKQNDTRWKHRRTAWEWAVRKLADYEAGKITIQDVCDFALQRGFFSVWYSVFQNHNAFKSILIDSFIGTEKNCFDSLNDFKPVPRNPTNANDPI